MGILDGIVEWIAEQVMNGLDLISVSVLGALGCDMGTFLRYFPAAETMYHIFVATGIGLVLLNWVWQLFKNFGVIAGVEAEDPVKLSIRSILFIGLIYYCDQITDMILAIGGTPYSWILSSDLPPLNFADYNIFKQASDTVRSGVIIGLGTRLQVFQNRMIRQITSYNEINLTLPGREKCAYFCITSDQDSAFDFLSSLFMSFVFIKLVRYADKYGEDGMLPVPVHILADELANGGCTIADLTKKISTIRSRKLSISCIFQNLPQMQNRYPLNQWQEIIGNCDTQLFLGCTDEMTAEFISNRTGEVSVAVSSRAKQLNTWRISDYTPEYRETHSIGKRKLLTPDEVLRLPLDQALIILRGQKVLKVEKYDYTLHPESSRLKPCKASEHTPAWRQRPQEEEPEFSKLTRPEAAPRKPKAGRKTSSAAAPLKPSVPAPAETIPEPAPAPYEEDCSIILTDKKSIMS